MPSEPLRRALVAVVIGGAFGVGGSLVYVHSRPREAVAAVEPPSSPVEAPLEPPADWCAPGFVPIAGGACLATPRVTPAESLIVYLHGRFARDASADEVDRQRRLASRATARGFAVLAFRGDLGRCTAPELATWYCWPSNETNAEAGAGVVSGWSHALAAAEERTSSRHRFLLGFSNGGYFAGLIASRGWLDVDALVVAHGGPVEPVLPRHGTPPFLLLSADDDVAQDEMIRFDEELGRAHWSHDSYARNGGHALADEDIDAALAFFARRGETLPLQPPLPLHRAVRHARDAADAGDDAHAPPLDPSEAEDASAPTAEKGPAPSDGVVIDAGPSDETADESPSKKTADEASDGG